ncbi:hypothetical protein IC582_001839 [Cucumis melo]
MEWVITFGTRVNTNTIHSPFLLHGTVDYSLSFRHPSFSLPKSLHLPHLLSSHIKILPSLPPNSLSKVFSVSPSKVPPSLFLPTDSLIHIPNSSFFF